MRLKEAGKLTMPITVLVSSRTKGSTDCSDSSGVRQKGLCVALAPLLTGITAPHQDTPAVGGDL